MNLNRARTAASGFGLAGEVVDVAALGGGHIHDSFLLTTRGEAERRWVLQRVNRRIFPDPVRLAETVARVTAHQHRVLERAGGPDAHRRALTLVHARDGRPSHVDDAGEHWRMFRHVDGARSHHRVATPALAAQVAAVAARFLTEMDDLPGPPPTDAIPGFRDFPARRRAFHDVLAADGHGRAAACGPEVDAIEAHSGVVEELEAARVAGRLPERVVHNDAKADNVLVDGRTGEGLCIVDLDTVASGTVLFDVGDLVRSATTTVGEDDPGAPAAVRADLLEAVVSAYLGGAGLLLTDDEIDLLSLAGPLMTYEAALRFLTDHLAGDVYFRLARPDQNLDRARAQLRLLDALVAAREQTADLVGVAALRVARG
jgi:aminoglycoside phosphotransferase (APT) family kinase protein